MNLYFVRHAESQSNAHGVLSGHSSVPLSSQGVSQAKELAIHLADNHFDMCFVSTLPRAVQTAQEILVNHNLHANQDARLCERSWGIWEGAPIDNYFSQLNRSNFRIESFCPPCGESLLEVEARVANFTAELNPAEDLNTLVITHLSVIKILALRALGWELSRWRDLKIQNASVTRFLLNESGELSLGSINEVDHLHFMTGD